MTRICWKRGTNECSQSIRLGIQKLEQGCDSQCAELDDCKRAAKMTTKQCKRCGNSFETSDHRVKYCGDTCSEMAVVERVQANHRKTGKAMVKLMPQRPPKQGNAEWVRAREYDEGYGEKLHSVYSPLAIIAIERNVSECKSCHCVKPLVNGYCEPCIVLGGNEKQVMKPTEIQARSRAGRENSAQSPWRFGIGKRA